MYSVPASRNALPIKVIINNPSTAYQPQSGTSTRQPTNRFLASNTPSVSHQVNGRVAPAPAVMNINKRVTQAQAPVRGSVSGVPTLRPVQTAVRRGLGPTINPQGAQTKTVTRVL